MLAGAVDEPRDGKGHHEEYIIVDLLLALR
jgi:hypothetical protein